MRVTGKMTKRALSLLLCLTILVSAMAFALSVRAEDVDAIGGTDTYDSTSNIGDDASLSKELADTGAGSGSVFCKNTDGWSAVYAYMWNSDSDRNEKWPGVQMTKVSDDIWRYDYTKSYAKIIFNIGSNQKQTTDLDFPGAGYIYDNSTNQWSVYETPPTSVQPTSVTPTTVKPTSAVTPTTAPTPGEKTYVYCENEAGWSTVTAYMWNNDSDKNDTWPGVPMTKIGGNTWRYEVPKSFAKIIFSNNGQSQTSDLTFPGKDYSWNNKTNSWSIRDTSPLQINSYGTDIESPVYNGVAVTLKASAEGENQSTVYYKFSVKNSSGAVTVLKDFNTLDSAQWIPQTAGSYTLIYDFKDGKGNLNNRTATFVVEDGSAVVTPFIKTVTPYSGDIQNGSNVKISVSAGGGKTGTNLLFYKYTVKNPSDSIVNVPYYTRNTTYTFKPTALGLHTLTINVQGSDNKTIERSYIFNSVGAVVPTEPPATEPPVKPTDAPPAPTQPQPTDAPPAPTQPQPTDAPPAPTQPVGDVVYGDADDDGDVTILDVTYIQRFEANIQLPAPLNKRNADVDGDDDVSIIDATLIQRYIAFVIKKFPVEE